jgi:hypothetical protein
MEDGGPAFPVPMLIKGEEIGVYEIAWPQRGMTLRDYFAAKALEGFIARDVVWDDEEMSHDAYKPYKLADAMLKARQSNVGPTK